MSTLAATFPIVVIPSRPDPYMEQPAPPTHEEKVVLCCCVGLLIIASVVATILFNRGIDQQRRKYS